MPSSSRLISLLCITACLLSSCAPASLVESWRCPHYKVVAAKYRTVLVASLLTNDEDRRRCETNVASQLQRHGIIAFTAYEYIPVKGRPSWQTLADAVKASGADSVMTIQALEPDIQVGFESGSGWMVHVSSYPERWAPELFPGWSLYTHYGYSTFRDTSATNTPAMLVQVNLFETQSNRLIWAGKFDIDPDPLPTGSAEVASLVVRALLEENPL